jgi:predicted transposase YbfD/YdcC
MMKNMIRIGEYFTEVETIKEYHGYFCSVGEALTIVILGTFCGLRNMNQIHQWATNDRIFEFLGKYFAIKRIPSYYWLLCLLKMIKPKSLNQCFIKWAQSFLPERTKGLTLSFDGKTIRSTGKMDKYASPLHIVSAHIAELGITLGQQTVEGKSNEIPAVRNLIDLLNIEGCIVVADALNCQKETAQAIIDGKADYLLNVKDNQQTLKEAIEDYVQDDVLRKGMDTFTTDEKNRGRIERRTAFSTCDISWVGKEGWTNLACIGAVNRQFTTKKGATNEWHYYISSRKLTAEELLKHARLEWSVETMHWLLDVHFGEDFCRVEDENVQQNLNIVRKIALNSVKSYKEKQVLNALCPRKKRGF